MWILNDGGVEKANACIDSNQACMWRCFQGIAVCCDDATEDCQVNTDSLLVAVFSLLESSFSSLTTTWDLLATPFCLSHVILTLYLG